MYKALISTCFLLLLSQQVRSAASSNEQFCLQALQGFADSLLTPLSVKKGTEFSVLPIGGRFGEALRHRIESRLRAQGMKIVPHNSSSSAGASIEALFSAQRLYYRGVDVSPIRWGRVQRLFELSGYCRFHRASGELVDAIEVANFIVSDTLTYAQAREVQGSEAFFAPALPPSPYKRWVEPGLIAGITGTLVYLFFASR